MSKSLAKIIILGLVIVSCALIILGISNWYLNQGFKKINYKISRIKTFQHSVKPAKKVTMPKVIFNLVGTVKKIKNNQLTLRATIPYLDQNGHPASKIESRIISVAPETKLSRLTFIQNYHSKSKIPHEENISFQDIKINDYIEVTGNTDISKQKDFTARQIRILPKK